MIVESNFVTMQCCRFRPCIENSHPLVWDAENDFPKRLEVLTRFPPVKEVSWSQDMGELPVFDIRIPNAHNVDVVADETPGRT